MAEFDKNRHPQPEQQLVDLGASTGEGAAI
jgi:hypothetical protein